MKNNLTDYLAQSRWCNFKEDLNWGRVRRISLEKLPFDDGRKLFVLGKAEVERDGEETKVHYFSMPLAVKTKISDNENGLLMNGQLYTDALNERDFWRSLMQLIKDNNGVVCFNNGWTLELNGSDILDEYSQASSRPLGVEQSNTTLSVADNTIAFKLERMLDFSTEVNPEFEMNEKLMREGATVMPETYGYLVWRNEKGEIASSGIIQEFVKNKGDMWGYLQSYLADALQEGYLQQRDLKPEEHIHFMELMEKLSDKTAEMGECLERDDANPNFSPENVDDNFIRTYGEEMKVLMYQTKRAISTNLMQLPKSSRSQAVELLENFDQSVGQFVKDRLDAISEMEDKGKINRVHGDFHLGQVMVTLDDDLKFIDFAGEPSLPIEKRKQKHIFIRDVAGMYRSIKGYLGAVAVEEFVDKAPDEEVALCRRNWASKAIKPLIDGASRKFLGEHRISEPWLSLEILRKNLYEVNYEVANRPAMAYVPISGLNDLLGGTCGGKDAKTMGAANQNTPFDKAL